MTADEILTKIWSSSSKLYKLTGLDPKLEDIQVVMGVEAWATLAPLARELEYVSAVHFHDGELRIFGLVAKRDDRLEPNELRFRAEVTL